MNCLGPYLPFNSLSQVLSLHEYKNLIFCLHGMYTEIKNLENTHLKHQYRMK
jgi:hypothetical protein